MESWAWSRLSEVCHDRYLNLAAAYDAPLINLRAAAPDVEVK